MNAKKLMAAVALSTLAGSVFAAGQNEFVDYVNIKSERTRDEVRAELAEANDQGQVTHAPEFVEHTRVASSGARDKTGGKARQAAVQSVQSAQAKQAVRSAKTADRNTSFVNYGA